MTIPNVDDLLLPFLKEIANGEEHRIGDIIEKLADEFNLSPEERLIKFSESSRDKIFANRIYFTRLNLKMANLISSPRRGSVKITQEGSDLIQKNLTSLTTKDIVEFEAYKMYKAKVKDKSGSEVNIIESEIISDQTPEESLESAYKTISEELKLEILDLIKSNSPDFFEELVIDLLLKMGYGGSRRDAGEKVGKSHDGGIDGIIKEDRLGLDIIYIQAKRWDNTVGRPEIQKFAGALEEQRANKGIFITTSQFSREAIDYVSKINKKIVLIDGDQLAQYMIDYDLGVDTKITYKIKTIDSDYFEEG